MKKKIIVFLIIISVLATTGCNGFKRENAKEGGTDLETVLDMEKLEDGGFYVLRGDEYEKLYVQDTNYELSDSSPTSPNVRHTLWYKDDWKKVPTLYKGDQLIYKTTNTLDETFSMERFEYVGYTIGISNLKETESGRFAFETSSDSMNINMNSDAAPLSELSTEQQSLIKSEVHIFEQEMYPVVAAFLACQKVKPTLLKYMPVQSCMSTS